MKIWMRLALDCSFSLSEELLLLQVSNWSLRGGECIDGAPCCGRDGCHQ